MSAPAPFTGFPPEGLRFLEVLAANNNKAWFEEHKQDYITYVQQPALAFIVALGQQLQAISPNINADTRVNGAGSLFRIHRDVRFSKDKTPYKTTADMVLWDGGGKKTESPGFAVRIAPDGTGMFAGMYGFPKPVLARYRQAVDDEKTGQALEAAVAQVLQNGDYMIHGESYKRVPRDYEQDHPRGDFLRYGGLYVQPVQMDLSTLSTPEFVDEVFEHCRNMAPVEQWLVKAVL